MDKIVDVRQRAFAIVNAGDKKSMLRTGNLGWCVAFYGFDPTRGIAFMCHIDGKVWGVNTMVRQLPRANDGSLRNYHLYVTANYTLVSGAAYLLFFLMVIWLSASVPDTWRLIFVVAVLGFGFCCAVGSLAQIYWLAWVVFKADRLNRRHRWQISGTVEVTLDSATGPRGAQRDLRSDHERDELHGPTQCWYQVMQPTDERAQRLSWWHCAKKSLNAVVDMLR